jgi:hypothetical protein
MAYDEGGGKSLFNAGIALTERIDALQRAMNASRFNPLARNFDVGKFNYEVMITSLDGLLMEAWAKMSDPERKDAARIKNLVYNFLEVNPIITNQNGQTKINMQNYKKFMQLIDVYEKKVKIYLDGHNLNAPNMDEDEGL